MTKTKQVAFGVIRSQGKVIFKFDATTHVQQKGKDIRMLIALPKIPQTARHGNMTLTLPSPIAPVRMWCTNPIEGSLFDFTPVHHDNAFLEDRMHDWDVVRNPKNAIRYSGVARRDGGLCLLLLGEKV